MKREGRRDIIHRHKKNPIINLEDLSFSCLNIMNAGAVKVDDQYILLVRIETMKGHSIFVVARSKNGKNFELDKKPIMVPAEEGEFKKFEEQGVADPRITYLEGVYYIVYSAVSKRGHRLALAKTADFKTIERVALISQPDNHNGALFPCKIKGDYMRVERPLEGGNIWISQSKDLISWGKSRVLMTARGSGFWDADRIGCAVPPIKIDEGWLLIYYGVRNTSAGPIFRLGAAILNGKDPSIVIGRTDIPILSPREYYERVGDCGNMVFSCGAIVEEERQELLLYYGGANMGINLGTAFIPDIIEECLKKETI
ncbi:MAG: glycoside hydrolase family 130 protein [Candidatus Omnitrophica bacterium]|nr:glycoside hydrolase family 130 protein [Candidatus Omnitrophota bacterium]